MAVQFFLCQKIKIRRNFFQRSADIHEGIFRILRDEIESIDFGLCLEGLRQNREPSFCCQCLKHKDGGLT